MATRPNSDADYFKSIAPSQFFSEKGADVVVINFGSSRLRMGMAFDSVPKECPHLIARFSQSLKEEKIDAHGLRSKGGISELKLNDSNVANNSEKRLHLLQFVEEELKCAGNRNLKKHEIIEEDDTGFAWTEVIMNEEEINALKKDKSNLETKEKFEDGEKEEEQKEEEKEEKEETEDNMHIEEKEEREEKEEKQEMDKKEENEEEKEEKEEKKENEEKKEEVKEKKDEIQESKRMRIEIEENQMEGVEKEKEENEDKKIESSKKVNDEDDNEEKEKKEKEEEKEKKEENILKSAVITNEIMEEKSEKVEKEEKGENEGDDTFKKEEIIKIEIIDKEVSSNLKNTDQVKDENKKNNNDNDNENGNGNRNGNEMNMHEDTKVHDEKIMKDDTKHYRKWICGDDIYKISHHHPYILNRPLLRGHFNVSPKYSMQQVLDDLAVIWNWMLNEKLKLFASNRNSMSVALVIPESLDTREIKELVTLVLKELNFSSVVVHQEVIASLFGNGISSGCIVNIGAQVTSISCVEDGALCPSRLVLPYGGEDISRLLLWIEKEKGTWLYEDCNPLNDIQDFLILENIKEKHVILKKSQLETEVEIKVRNFSEATKRFKFYLSSGINVSAMGLFYPQLFCSEKYKSSSYRWYCGEYEDTLEEFALSELGKNSEVAVTTAISASNKTKNADSADFSTIGLHDAIIKCITSQGSLELQNKLFNSILVIGGSSQIRGLPLFLQQHLASSIPSTITEPIEILPPRLSPSLIPWKGGSIMSVLDWSREGWLQKQDWIEGVRFGNEKKYKDSLLQQTQLFWFSSNVE